MRLRVAAEQGATPDEDLVARADAVLADAVADPAVELVNASVLVALVAWAYERLEQPQRALQWWRLLQTRGDVALARRRAAAAVPAVLPR